MIMLHVLRRLYSSAHYNDTFPKHTPPEILNAPLEGVVLLLKAMSVDKVRLPDSELPSAGLQSHLILSPHAADAMQHADIVVQLDVVPGHFIPDWNHVLIDKL